VIHGRLDELGANKDLGDGIMGWVDHIDGVLEKKPEALAAAEKDIFTGINEHMNFSQQQIYRLLEKLSFEESHVSNHPFTIPDNVVTRIEEQKRIKELEDKIKKFGENKQTRKRIEALKKQQTKILTPKQELKHIYEKLGGNKDFAHTKEYHRLVELANYWPQARKLLDRIHLEDSHHAQKAYRDVLDAFAKIIKGNLSPLANPERVTHYLKTRLEQTTGKITPMAEKEKVKVEPVKAEEAEATTEADQATVNQSDSETLKNEYNKVRRKAEQFKKSGTALKNLVDCALGSKNGEV